jgi:PhzF family phenazine biosynthesis protein
MKVSVKIINAFSVKNQGGNPAGVVLDADGMTNEKKQLIASKIGLPETAFVSRSAKAGYKLDFFTPTKQIPHCGHATIATFTYLKRMGLVTSNRTSKETIDGIREIIYIGGYAFMEQRSPTFYVPENKFEVILQSLGINETDLVPNLNPTIVNTGNSFLMVPVKDERVLSNIKPNLDLISGLSEEHSLIGYYVYTHPRNTNALATTRMFAPYYGINEEAATGMAAGPLACFLYEKEKIKESKMLIEQGQYMNPASPSQIQVHLHFEEERIARLYAGGDANLSGERTIEV